MVHGSVLLGHPSRSQLFKWRINRYLTLLDAACQFFLKLIQEGFLGFSVVLDYWQADGDEACFIGYTVVDPSYVHANIGATNIRRTCSVTKEATQKYFIITMLFQPSFYHVPNPVCPLFIGCQLHTRWDLFEDGVSLFLVPLENYFPSNSTEGAAGNIVTRQM